MNAEDARDQKTVPGVLAALFTGDELSLALGRANVIHIGLKRGEMARRFISALQKAKAFEAARQGQPEQGQPEQGRSERGRSVKGQSQQTVPRNEFEDEGST